MDEISQKVDLVCKALGVRQNKLAEMLGITPTFLSRVKNGIQKSKVVDLKLDVLLSKYHFIVYSRPSSKLYFGFQCNCLLIFVESRL